MDTRASFSPEQYVNALRSMTVDGYTGYPNGEVELNSYLSAKYAVNNGAKLKAAIAKYSPMTIGKIKPLDYARVWSGQGQIVDFETILGGVNENSEKFKADAGFKKYFDKTDFLQAMLDDSCLGMDCVGFVGTYLDFAGINRGYFGSAPMDYSGSFPFVQDLTQIKPLSVVVHCNGMHIQIINSIESIQNDHLMVTLCQSSSGGPQINRGVKLSHGTGNVLDVDGFRAEKKQKLTDAAYQEWLTSDAAHKGKPKVAFDNEVEAELRKKYMTVPATAIGYAHGAVFSVDGGGKNPVAGNVYVGTLKSLHVIDWNTETI